LNTSKLTAFI